MSAAALALGILSILAGLSPFLTAIAPLGGPIASAVTLALAALGVPLGLAGVILGLIGRRRALQARGLDLALPTAGLSSAVIGTLLCAAWIGGLYYAQRQFARTAAACRSDPRLCAPAGLRPAIEDRAPARPAPPR